MSVTIGESLLYGLFSLGHNTGASSADASHTLNKLTAQPLPLLTGLHEGDSFENQIHGDAVMMLMIVLMMMVVMVVVMLVVRSC